MHLKVFLKMKTSWTWPSPPGGRPWERTRLSWVPAAPISNNYCKVRMVRHVGNENIYVLFHLAVTRGVRYCHYLHAVLSHCLSVCCVCVYMCVLLTFCVDTYFSIVQPLGSLLAIWGSENIFSMNVKLIFLKKISPNLWHGVLVSNWSP